MKIQFPVLALALLFPISSHAADQLAQARAHYAAVNKAVPAATVVKRELQGYSLEGGDLTACFQRGVPLKMTANFYGESGKATEEYYFWQGRLFFIVRTSWHYNGSLNNPNPPQPIKLIRDQEQERWYFKNGQLWRWINQDGQTIKAGAELKNQQENYLNLSRELLAGARAKDKIINAR